MTYVAVSMGSPEWESMTRTIRIVHLSDLHFGNSHIYVGQIDPAGNRVPDPEYSLLKSILSDLESTKDRFNVGAGKTIACLTGDITETGSYQELREAEGFIRGLAASDFFRSKTPSESVLVVPGNHDLHFSEDTPGARWRDFAGFCDRVQGFRFPEDEPEKFGRVIDWSQELGAIFVLINSASYVFKGSPEASRGRIGGTQLDAIEAQLRAIRPEVRNACVRIALVHHHPVMIPTFAEPGRGYDAIHSSGELLRVLHRFGFQAILHGHKHNPHVFSEDIRSAFEKVDDSAMVIVAGGSAGSTELDAQWQACNTYSNVTVAWHPKSRQSRVQVITRGLVKFDGAPLHIRHWKWRTIFRSDRVLGVGDHPEADFRKITVKSFENASAEGLIDEKSRTKGYAHLRGNMPVVEVRPSCVEEQTNEAIVWLVGHDSDQHKREPPVRVTWSAGSEFETYTIEAADDPFFCVSLHYWGPVLVQGRITFQDGTIVNCHVYARIPEQRITATPRDPDDLNDASVATESPAAEVAFRAQK